MFIVLDEPESGGLATCVAFTILLMILVSSFTFMFESHPYVRCTYSAGADATCSGNGDPTTWQTCEMGQTEVNGVLVNNTYTPSYDAIGMYEDCEAATTVGMCEGTIALFGKESDEHHQSCKWADGQCTFIGLDVEECSQWNSPFEGWWMNDNPTMGTVTKSRSLRHAFRMIECVAIFSFTVEYVLRMALCTQRPRKDRRFFPYFFKVLNIIDLFAIVPFYIELAMGGKTSLGILRILRLARVFRVMKLGNAIGELRLFMKGYYRAREGLLLLFFLLFLYLCVFAAVLYLLEYDTQTIRCYENAGICAVNADNTTSCMDDLCYQDLTGEYDDEIKGKVNAANMYVEGPDAMAPFTGDYASCEKCHFQAYNCTNALVNATHFQVLTTSPWDGLTGAISGACASVTGPNCTYGTCGGLVAEIPCSGDLLDSVLSESDSEMPLASGWHDQNKCLQCKDLGCSTRGFTSIPTTWYFIMATMTTVGYGDHYPVGLWGQITAGFVMLIGILVLALPIIVIGQAFEEVIKEQERFDKEREERLELKNLERFGTGGKDVTPAVKKQLHFLTAKAEKEEVQKRHDTEACVHVAITLLNTCHKETGEARFRNALLICMQDYQGSEITANQEKKMKAEIEREWGELKEDGEGATFANPLDEENDEDEDDSME